MAATDARPVPRKNAAFRHYFAIRKNDGTLITSWTGADSEVSLDGAAFSDCTNEATEIGSSGCGYIDLTSTEMNADAVVLKITVSNASALPLVFVLYPEEAGDYRADVTHFGGSAGTFSGGRPEVNTTHAAGTAWGSGAITAASIAADAITAAKIADGAIDAATFAAGAINASAIAADAITAAKVAADVTTELQSGLATASALSTVAGYLDTEVAAILAAVDTEVAAIKAKTDNLPASPAATGDIPSAASIADAVWDEAVADHNGAGSTGAALAAAGGSGDPWSTALPGAYSSGTAGYIIGTNLNATVSSRLASASYTAPLDAAGVRAAVGLASANLDTQLTAIDDYLDTELAAVKAKTDLLPSDPADQSAVEAAILAAWTTALTESYAANGAAFTPAQGLYAIHQMLMDFAISGTTISVKQLGGTEAFAVTLDDATTPTSASRA